MAAQVTISQLPTAGPLTGTELVPVVQNGGTVKTTVADIAASPNNTQTFLTVNQEPSLANSRYLAGNNGITLSDGGAQNPLVVELTGAALQFFNAPAGLIAKPTATTVAARILLAGAVACPSPTATACWATQSSLWRAEMRLWRLSVALLVSWPWPEPD